MRRRVLCASIVVAAFSPSNAWAQTSNTLRRIGVLVDGFSPNLIATVLPQKLGDLGYVEGRTIAFETLYADARQDLADQLASELVRQGVDVIVAHFTPAVRAAMKATKTIPIVMAPAGAPVEVGLVASLSHPGGNITGVTNMAAELGGRRIQLLRDLVPNLKRVAVLASTQDPFTKPFLSYMQGAASSAGISLAPVMITGRAEFEAAFETMSRSGAQAVVIQGTFNSGRATTVALAIQHRLAFMSFDHNATRIGGLISISGDTTEIFTRAASMVDRILKGADPANLPVEQPTKYELVINLKTAKALGLNVPLSMLTLADEVIE
jgi:putative ABC transport system substrate-binding protein